jgi:hypothetical protein
MNIVHSKNTSLDNAAYVPQQSVRHEEMPQGVSIQKIPPSGTQRTSHNAASAMRRCPKECLFNKNSPLGNTAYAPQRSVRYEEMPQGVLIQKILPLENTAYAPQRSVHKEEMPQGKSIQKTPPLRTQRTSHNAASIRRRCPEECLFQTDSPLLGA